MVYSDVYDSINPMVICFSFLGLTPYVLRRNTENIKYLKLDYFAYFLALVFLGGSIALEIDYLKIDILSFKDGEEPVDKLTILTYCVMSNLYRLVAVYFILSLVYYKKLATVLCTLFEVDQMLTMKGITINHQHVAYSILGVIIVSTIHCIVRMYAEVDISIFSYFDIFYNFFVQIFHAYFVVLFLVLTYLVKQRFNHLTAYLKLRNEEKVSKQQGLPMFTKQAWMSVDLDNNINCGKAGRRSSQSSCIISNAMELHARLQKCMVDLNECFQIPLMFFFIREFLNIVHCFYIFYGVLAYGVEHNGTEDELIAEIILFTQSYTKVTALTWCCQVLADESKSIIRVVYRLARRSDVSTVEKRKLRHFVMQLMHNANYEISIMGFYNANCASHFDMLTTMFNYVMVIITLRYY